MDVGRFLVSVLLAISIAVSSALAGVPAARAATSSDIPGIPLPAPVVTGLLGGPIYDVVYSVVVPAGYVLVGGLAGTAGTDFDLYLFDSGATTVLSNTGLVTKSTGPTSSEQISWATRTGGTFYVDLNGASDVEGTYTLSVQIVPDSTPPVASLHVAGGVTVVNTPTVTLQLAGFDDLSGVLDMSLSNDGTNWSMPAPLQNQFTWTLPPGDGPKTVWAEVMNGVGLWSKPVSVGVTLDTTSPTVVSVSPADKAVVTTARPVISVVFSEAMDASSWYGLGLVLQSPTGGIVPGTYAYYPATRTGTFTPSSDLLAGYVYIATIGDVQDLAGNKVAGASSWTFSYLPQSSVTAQVSPRISVTGTRVTLSGIASLPAGESLQLEAKVGAATSYSLVGTIVPSSGRYSLTLIPAMNTTYRVSYPGSATNGAASAEAAAIVRRTVSLPGVSASTTHAARIGRAVTLRAQVLPAGVASVSFRLYRYDSLRRRWVYAGSYGRTTQANGLASLTWTPRTTGAWYWRVVVNSTPEFANNISPVYRYTVTR